MIALHTFRPCRGHLFFRCCRLGDFFFFGRPGSCFVSCREGWVSIVGFVGFSKVERQKEDVRAVVCWPPCLLCIHMTCSLLLFRIETTVYGCGPVYCLLRDLFLLLVFLCWSRERRLPGGGSKERWHGPRLPLGASTGAPRSN